MLSLAITMTRFLKIVQFNEIPQANIDGHMFRLLYEIGHMTGSQFQRDSEGTVDVVISRTLQHVWGVPDNQIQYPTGTVAATKILEQASIGTALKFEAIHLNTFSAPERPPDNPSAIAGALIPIPEEISKQEVAIKMLSLSILSDDISKIIDEINAISKNMWGDTLLKLTQVRQLLDIYKSAKTEEEFKNRVQSIAGLAVSINKELIGSVLAKPDTNSIGSILLLQELLSRISSNEKAESTCKVFKEINNLRKGYPTHGDNIDDVLPAHDFFKIPYPIPASDYESAWESVLGSYFEAMKGLLEILSIERARKIAGTNSSNSFSIS